MSAEKIEKTNIQSYFPKRYYQFWNSNKVNKGHSGTAIFSLVEPEKISYDIGIAEHD